MVSMIVQCIDKPLFSYSLLFFLYSTMILEYNHAHNRKIKGGVREGGVDI